MRHRPNPSPEPGWADDSDRVVTSLFDDDHPELDDEPIPLTAVQHQLARRLSVEGRPNAVLCAALLLARAASGLDLEAFAASVPIDPALLRALEQGRADPHLVPPGLPRLAPDLDWSSLPPAPSPPRPPVEHEATLELPVVSLAETAAELSASRSRHPSARGRSSVHLPR